jgi:L-ascorbate metabolism protein UlaG (beta-lactamase superfamily)
MKFDLTWLGHATWLLETAQGRILVDPFLTGNPAASRETAHLPQNIQADVILISHGHEDHLADAATIAKRTNALVVANYEIATWFAKKFQLSNTLGMNLGGSTKTKAGKITMTLAFHSSQLPDGSYGGNPCGFVVEVEEKRIYFACDTALFSDMQLIGRQGLEAAILPIGDLYTMGPEDAIDAVKFLDCEKVFPSHFNTWPPISQDAAHWANRVVKETSAEPIVLSVGKTYTWSTTK